MYDLKTIQGKGSAGTQLMDSIGQSDRVLLHIVSNYSDRILASDIKSYFEVNPSALEVLVFKRRKAISVRRRLAFSPLLFNRLYRGINEK